MFLRLTLLRVHELTSHGSRSQAKEKEAKKAERDAKKAEKRDKEEKQKAVSCLSAMILRKLGLTLCIRRRKLLAKQKNMLSGFFVKKSTSPAPVEASRSPDKSKPESDFDKVFFPFQIKANVKVAPPNRWAKKKGAVDVKVNSDESLTAKGERGTHVFAEGRADLRSDAYRRHQAIHSKRTEAPHLALQPAPRATSLGSPNRRRDQRVGPVWRRRARALGPLG